MVPGDPFPSSLHHHGMAAACSLLFGAATLVAVLMLLQLARVAAFSSLAVILVVASGAASAAGGAGLCLGASRELASFRVIAASESGPKPDEVAAAVEYALGPCASDSRACWPAPRCWWFCPAAA